ncbi:hypothetical protein AB5I41_31445 [Sphingomonas sp. MMS24-JH45]
MQNNPFDQFDGPTGNTVITKRANPFDLPKDAATLANTQVNTATNRAQLPFVADTASAQRDKAIADAARAEYERRNQPGDKRFDRADKLRADYEALPSVKTYTAALPVYAAGLRSGADAAGDLNLIYAYAKVMDPNSVVREGEQASVAGGTLGSIRRPRSFKSSLAKGGRSSLVPAVASARKWRSAWANSINSTSPIAFATSKSLTGMGLMSAMSSATTPARGIRLSRSRCSARSSSSLIITGCRSRPARRKTQRNPEVEALAGSLIRGGLPYEQVSKILRQNGASGDIDRQQFDTMREAIAQGYQGPAADTAQEVASTAWNRFSGSDLGIGLQAGLDAGFAGLTDDMGRYRPVSSQR